MNFLGELWPVWLPLVQNNISGGKFRSPVPKGIASQALVTTFSIAFCR